MRHGIGPSAGVLGRATVTGFEPRVAAKERREGSAAAMFCWQRVGWSKVLDDKAVEIDEKGK